MTGDPSGDEKTGFLTKTERATVSRRGTIAHLLSGIGNGRKMALVILEKTAFHILPGTAVDREDVPGGIRVSEEAPQLGFTTTVILEAVGIQIVVQWIGITMVQEGIPAGILKEQVAFPVGI